MNFPTHIAIIPDGNRRWAKAKGLPSFMGHRAGAKSSEAVFDAAYAAGLKYLTFWIASISNITKRDSAEVAFLFKLFEEYFSKMLTAEIIKKREIRIRVLGFWDKYAPESLKNIIIKLEKSTKNHTKHHLTFLLAYNGTDEMLNAIQSLVGAQYIVPLPGEPHQIAAADIKQHLFTYDLPPVDLVIRTGGDPHLSTGFMMWDVAEARLHFSDKMWPDFDKNDLTLALTEYGQAERRHGGG